MTKRIFILLLLVCIALDSSAKKHKTLTKVMILKADRVGGANGAAVAWDPEHQKYYTAMAGNTYFPMFVYNAEGKIISDNTLETMFDIRGLWYNPTSKTLQSNGYNDFGLAEYKMDDKDIPQSISKLPIATHQPKQSQGAYDAEHNVIYFYDYNSSGLTREDLKGDTATVALHLGVKKKSKIKGTTNSEVRNNYNENACVYTGIPKAEIGLLNSKNRQIELYNINTGLLKKVLKLPADAPVEASLNFSYSNGTYWLFDKKKREWRGYQ